MYKCKLELCAQADLPPGERGQTAGGERERCSNEKADFAGRVRNTEKKPPRSQANTPVFSDMNDFNFF